MTHAVRWIIGKSQRYTYLTKWHYTDNGYTTRCGRYIKLQVAKSDDNLNRVDCKLCLSRKR